MFTLISSKMIGKDTFVKNFELSYLLLEESYIFAQKYCGRHFFWKRLNEHYNWLFCFRMPKMNISSYQQREPAAITYCYHEEDLRKESYLTYTIILLLVTILDLYKIIICKLPTIYTPFLRKRNVCSHP